MPKKQIHVVSLSPLDKVEQVEEVPSNEDDINQIKEAIKQEESQQVEQVEPILEPKPKRKPPAKKPKVVEEVVEPLEEPVVEPVVEVKEETPPKKVKTLELVKCDKCNKEMTKRTLRYDHPKTCKGAPINRDEIPVQKRTKPASPPKVVQPTVIPDDIIEQEVKKIIQNSIQDRLQMKLRQKEERIKKLAEKIT